MAASTKLSLVRTQHRTAKAGPDPLHLCVALDWANGQAITIGAASAAGNVFDAKNDLIVMVSANAACWITVAVAPVAAKAAGSMSIPASGQPVPIYVPAGMTIAVIQDSSSGIMSAVPALVAQ